ncbi:MAG: VOC family protein, partial [Treponema sp.]|nr:VOC family protein [Treponema sp.]
MTSVEIDFVVPDVLAAFDAYSKAFGAEAIEKSSLEKGLNEVIFTVFGTRFHILDENPDAFLVAPKEGQGGFMWFNLVVDDIKDVFEKASAAGFSTILEIQEVPMSSLPAGSKTAMQKDPWGYIWQLH